MLIFTVGCNHRTATVAVRERLAFSEAACADALAHFKQEFPRAEAVLLSTCNRTELYVARPLHAQPRLQDAVAWLSQRRSAIPHSALSLPAASQTRRGEEGTPHLHAAEDRAAVQHLFRVVAGLDSMVVGESQIVQQTKRAMDLARQQDTAGQTLGALFEKSLAVARDVRQRTGIGQGRFSVGSIAVDLAGQFFPRFEDKTVLMIGAGKMGELTLRHLADKKPRRVWLCNRTQARAAGIATRLGAEVRPFEHVDQWVAESDMVVASLTCERPVLTLRRLHGVPAIRRFRPLLLLDLGVPRNIEAEVGQCDGFHLYNIDDLQEAAATHRLRRSAGIAEGQRLIEAHVAEYFRERARRDAAPIVSALRRQLEEIAEREYRWIVPKLSPNQTTDPTLVRQLLHRMVNKVLHAPSVALHDMAEQGKAEVYGEMLRKLFDRRRDD